MASLKKMMVIFITIITLQSYANQLKPNYVLPRLNTTDYCFEKSSKIGGGTISTEIDMRGEQHVTVNTENPKENVVSVFIVDSIGIGTVFEGCMSQKCSYKIKNILLPGVHTATVRTNTGRIFIRSFEI